LGSNDGTGSGFVDPAQVVLYANAEVREKKSGKAWGIIVLGKDISRFNISMDDAVAVEMKEALD
jgi:hypothetical protein